MLYRHTLGSVHPKRWLAVSLSPLLLITLIALLAACQPVQPVEPVAATVDRVGFPENYQTEYEIFYEFDRPDNRTARVIYANDVAASVNGGDDFPYGSVLVMEVYRTERDDAGAVLLDENGRFVRGELAGIFVMRKEPGFGEKYGAARNGEWEYVAYRPDQSNLTPPERTMACASCHVEAGMGRDWVFGADRHFGVGPDLAAAAAMTDTVTLADYLFVNGGLTVPAGTEVKWVSHDVVYHTVTANDGSFTAILRPDGSFRHTFEAPGEYDYFCAVHPSMRGKITVTE